MAGDVYITGIVAVALIVAVVLAIDLWRWLTGRQTISAWLRIHPLDYWVPLVIIEAALVVLTWHLFGGIL